MFKIPNYQSADCQILKPVDTDKLRSSLQLFIDQMGVNKKQIGLRYADDFEGIGHLLNKEINPKGYRDPDFSRWIEGTEYLQEVAKDIGIRERGRVRLLLLAPYTCYSIHTDPDMYRTHIPLITNDSSFMLIDGTPWYMPTGYAYLVDVSKKHTAINAGSTNRIHLVVSVPPLQVKANFQ